MDKPAVLFLTFNRPALTARVFAAIQAARPDRLYLAADGPRPREPGDEENCAAVRRIVSHVDWPCQVRTLFRTGNLGCRRAVSEAITWFFEHEPEGIVLEDDTLPNADFFRFCGTLLERYRETPAVMAVCGGSYFDGAAKPGSSYCFTRVFDAWGWASWRRAWQFYERDMRGLESFLTARAIRGLGPPGLDYEAFWAWIFRMTAAGRIDTWDYQFYYSIFLHRGLVAYPRDNLVSNLGFGPEATHSRVQAGDHPPRLADRPLESLSFPLVHPRDLAPDLECEAALYAVRHGLTPQTPLQRLLRGARRLVASVVPGPVKAALRDL